MQELISINMEPSMTYFWKMSGLLIVEENIDIYQNVFHTLLGHYN
jgi:hypothetical protein